MSGTPLETRVLRVELQGWDTSHLQWVSLILKHWPGTDVGQARALKELERRRKREPWCRWRLIGVLNEEDPSYDSVRPHKVAVV